MTTESDRVIEAMMRDLDEDPEAMPHPPSTSTAPLARLQRAPSLRVPWRAMGAAVAVGLAAGVVFVLPPVAAAVVAFGACAFGTGFAVARLVKGGPVVVVRLQLPRAVVASAELEADRIDLVAEAVAEARVRIAVAEAKIEHVAAAMTRQEIEAHAAKAIAEAKARQRRACLCRSYACTGSCNPVWGPP